MSETRIHGDLVDALRPVWALLLPMSENTIGSDHPLFDRGRWFGLTRDLAPLAAAGARTAWDLTVGEPPHQLSDLCHDVARFLQVTNAVVRCGWGACPGTDEEWEELRVALEALHGQADELFRTVLEADPAALEEAELMARKAD